MQVDAVELRQLQLPLVGAFRTSFGTQEVRTALLVRVVTADAEGWGECVAGVDPWYSSEYVDGADEILRRYLVPTVLDAAPLTAADVARLTHAIQGHRMAKAALEMAVLDAQLRASGTSLATWFGAMRTKVPVGVSVGIFDDVRELLDAVDGYLDDGYRRIKLKIEPGWDVAVVAAVRDHVGGEIALQVDANTAYTRDDADHLRQLDAFDLLLLEQPLAADDLLGHARLADTIATPICLDESITSARVAVDAIELGATSIVNIKAGRVGGYLEAKAVHDACAERDVPVWCGGMLETGLGRAANLALASLPNFTLPGDISASTRYFAQDVTTPFEVVDGHMRVPDGPGLGVAPLPDVLDALTTKKHWCRR